MLKGQFHFILFELDHFQNYFAQARAFTRTFDRGDVRGENIFLKHCKLLLFLS